MSAFEVLIVVTAFLAASMRWLRVAQAEHYLAGSVTRFARRWWTATPANLALLGVAALGLALQTAGMTMFGQAFVAAGVGAAGPLGLGLRGRTSKLTWTRRMKTLAGVTAGFALLAATALWRVSLAGLVVLAAPLVVDLACWLVGPFEVRAARKWVDRAAERVRQVRPIIVGITGSYGKTGTKAYVAHLLSGTRTVVPSPRSFNNRAGLARAINEHLVPGTEVFVAEMGTYGRGEIADLCRWLPPEVAIITAIGPVHLERFRTEDAIVEAKSEILVSARTVVLNVDDPRLAAVADRAQADGKRVLRCSAIDRGADVAVVVADTVGGTAVEVLVAGAVVTRLNALHAPPTNVACAVAVAVALETPLELLATRLGSLPPVENRLSAVQGRTGAIVLDDTFNSNPAGAARALDALAAAAPEGRRVVVTPGMVELGPRQHDENRAFAAAAAKMATDLVVVGRTNRRALLEGANEGDAAVVTVATRPDAVAWVSKHVGPGDAVLYENDLPDLYP